MDTLLSFRFLGTHSGGYVLELVSGFVNELIRCRIFILKKYLTRANKTDFPLIMVSSCSFSGANVEVTSGSVMRLNRSCILIKNS